MITINNRIKDSSFLKLTVNGCCKEKDIYKLIPLVIDVNDNELRMLVVIENLDVEKSLDALDERLKTELLFLRKVKKCAFLTEEKWLKVLGRIDSICLTSMHIKTFDPNQEIAAKNWLLKSSPEPGYHAER